MVKTAQMAADGMSANAAMNARLGLKGKAGEGLDRTLLMGVLNVTEDSFSDGGLWLDPQAAVKHAFDMAQQGADLIDIGAESTRPGSRRVPADLEEERIRTVVSSLRSEGFELPLSIDTTRASVARAALKAGANVINDVSGGQLDPDLPALVAQVGCPYIVQDWRGWLTTGAGASSARREVVQGRMSQSQNQNGQDPVRIDHEPDLVQQVREELRREVEAVLAAGVRQDQIIIDPGLGFSKPAEGTNLPLIAALDLFQASGYPVLVGASRKRFIVDMADRFGGSAAMPETGLTLAGRDAVTAGLTALIAERGAWAVRVHEISGNRGALIAGARLREYDRRKTRNEVK